MSMAMWESLVNWPHSDRDLQSPTGRHSHQLRLSLLRVGTDKVIPVDIIHQHIQWLWCLNEVSHQEDCLGLLCCTASTMKHPPICSQIRSPVVDDISHFDTAALQKCDPHWHSVVWAQVASADTAAQLVFSMLQYDRVTSFLHQLQQLKRTLNLMSYVYKCQHGEVMSYLANEL